MLADVTRLLVAGLYWGTWGPVRLTHRFADALLRRLPGIDADSPSEAAMRLLASLPVSAEEQRRLVYEVMRETFGIHLRVWEEAVAIALNSHRFKGAWIVPTDESLALLMTDDETMWLVLAQAALACASREPAMAQAAHRARQHLRPSPFKWAYDVPRPVLVELLADDAEESNAARIRELLLGEAST